MNILSKPQAILTVKLNDYLAINFARFHYQLQWKIDA